MSASPDTSTDALTDASTDASPHTSTDRQSTAHAEGGGSGHPLIRFDHSDLASPGFVPLLQGLIADHQLTRVCDVGGGANPALTDQFIVEQGLDYTLLDVSELELSKASDRYTKVLADIASPSFSEDANVTGRFDLLFSRMVAEHIADPAQFHRNVLSCLAPGGFAVHFFPTLYALPFVANRLIPERLSSALLSLFAPRDRDQHDKFPAYYRWCRGPTPRQLARLKSEGFEIVEYRGYFGHGGYYRRLPPILAIHEWRNRRLLRRPKAGATSYAMAVLRKPHA